MHSNDTFYQGVITKFIHGKSKNQLSTAVSVSDYIKTICTSKQHPDPIIKYSLWYTETKIEPHVQQQESI